MKTKSKQSCLQNNMFLTVLRSRAIFTRLRLQIFFFSAPDPGKKYQSQRTMQLSRSRKSQQKVSSKYLTIVDCFKKLSVVLYLNRYKQKGWIYRACSALSK